MQDTTQHNSVDRQIKQWFDEIIAELRLDEALYETDLLHKEKRDLYKILSSGNKIKIHEAAYNQARMFFIETMLFDYLDELRGRSAFPKKLAFDISKSKILVWAEIEDDNQDLEQKLILCEAKVNARFFPHGFSITSTIVERSDQLDIPPHYKTLNS